MPELTAWLERFAADPEFDGREYLWDVRRMPGWLIATDGKAMGAVPDDGRAGVKPWVGPTDTAVFRQFQEDVPAAALTLDVAALREWCGPVDLPCENHRHDEVCLCPECDQEHPRPCSNCGGTGISYRYLTRNMGTLGDLLFNRRVLGWILDGAPGETVALWHEGTHRDPLRIAGDGWRAVLMGIAETVTTREGWETRALEALAAQPTPEAP